MLYYFKYERNLLFSFSKVPGRTISVGMFILIRLHWSLWPLQVIPKICGKHVRGLFLIHANVGQVIPRQWSST